MKKTEKIAFTPLFDRVVIKPHSKKVQEEQNKFGIITSASPEKKVDNIGVVVAVGDGMWNEDGDARIPPSVCFGDSVLYTKYDGETLLLDGEEYVVVSEKSIIGIFK